MEQTRGMEDALEAEPNAVPEVFRPIVPEDQNDYEQESSSGGGGAYLYRDLSYHTFSPGEKFFFCEELEGNTKRLERSCFSLSKYHSKPSLCKRYNMNENTVQTWLKKYRKNELFRKKGRPATLDEQGTNSVIAALICAQHECDSMNIHGFKEVVRENHLEKNKREGENITHMLPTCIAFIYCDR